MKKEKYKVTGAFGMIPEGTVIDCYVLNIGEDVRALIYHPPSVKYYDGEKIVVDQGCGSFEICELNDSGEWQSIDNECYVNFGKIDAKFKRFLRDAETEIQQRAKKLK